MTDPDHRKKYSIDNALKTKIQRRLSQSPEKRFHQPQWKIIHIGAGFLLFFILLFSAYFYLHPLVKKTNLQPEAPPTAQPEKTDSTTINAIITSSPRIIDPVDDRFIVDIYQDFKYIPTGWPMGLSVGQTSAPGLNLEPYEDLKHEPVYRSKPVMYGYLPMGNGEDRKISFVVDQMDQPAWICYVDTNNNEDLTDDGPPHANEGTGKMAVNVFVNVEIVLDSGETIITPYDLWMWIVESNLGVRFYARCHYAGKLRANDLIYDAIAFEATAHNGLFRESGLWIDLNRDGKLTDPEEHFWDGSVVNIDGESFKLFLNYP